MKLYETGAYLINGRDVVIDSPEAALAVESKTGKAVNKKEAAENTIAYGILKAVKDGLLDKSYLKVAAKAVAPVMDYISDEGVVNQVSYGTPMGRTTKNFYKEIELQPMPYGQALAILFLMEYRTMC